MSRESVVWSEHTRNFLVKRFKEAVVEATNMIQEEIDVDDFLDWIGKCSGVKSRVSSSSNNVLYQLSKVINIDDISPSYKSTNIQLQHPETFFRGLRVRYCYSSYDNKKRRDIVKRDELKRWGDFTADKVYLKTMPTSSKVDHYLHEKDGSFVTIEIMDDEQIHKEYITNDVLSKRVEPKYLDQCMQKRDEIIKLIKASAKVKSYDSIDVPKDFGKKFEEAEVKDEEMAMSAKEKRKLLGKIAVHQMVPNSSYWNGGSAYRPFTFSQQDEEVAKIQDYEGEIIYGFNDDAPALMLLGQVLDAQTSQENHIGFDCENKKFHTDEIRIIKISKQSEKHFRDNDRFKHVSDFFQKVEDIDG